MFNPLYLDPYHDRFIIDQETIFILSSVPVTELTAEVAFQGISKSSS